MTDTAPLEALDNQTLLRELAYLYETRLDTLRHGSPNALENHSHRMRTLEAEYVRRVPQREVSEERLRPEDV